MIKHWHYLIPISFLLIGCGTTDDTSPSNGEGSIDLRSYLESEDINKNYQLIYKGEDGTLSNDYYTEVITVSDNLIERSIDGIIDTRIAISDDRLTHTDVALEGDLTVSFYRHVDLGEDLFTQDINHTEVLTIGEQEIGTQSTLGNKTCRLEEALQDFTSGSNVYTGNILKFKCTINATITTHINDEFVGIVNYVNGTEDTTDVSYYYQKENIGLIAALNDDCIPTGMHYPDDSIDNCDEASQRFSYIYYLGD